MTVYDLAFGKWPDLLSQLAGLSDEQLTDKHQPCPLCGGKDRYRFDDQDGNGSWFCNQCGGKDRTGGAGNGMDMLIRRNNWTFKEACSRVDSYLGGTPDAPIAGAEHVWWYNTTFAVCRFPGKKIRPLSFIAGKWEWKAPPEPRPLYNLAKLKANLGAPVLIVEGEKTCDAATKLFPQAVCVTWASGCKAIDKTDWSPLANRRCTLWPDADDVGHEAMSRLAAKLTDIGAKQVRHVETQVDWPEGWDLADADWTPKEAAAYLSVNRSTPIQPPSNDSNHFTCLGFDSDGYFYQPHCTGQVIRLSRSSHTGTNLVALAPLSYWETLYPSRTGVNWTSAASSLFQLSSTIGVYNPDRIRGRGAWWDNGRSILHFGDRLIVDGEDLPVSSGIPGSQYLYQRLSKMNGPVGCKPLDDEHSLVLALLANRFHWEVPASGVLLAGWIALAPVCGALDWRPHAWLTGSAGSGKSAILERYVTPLLGDMGLIVSGNTTEAGIRQELRADARPVVFDEAESNERADQQRMQTVLSLARVASSESKAHMLKGSPDGDAQRFTIRSMFLMSSIATNLKQGADKSRFAQLCLRNPSDVPKDERTAHWDSLDHDLDKYVSQKIGRQLQARTIALIPTIRKSARIFTKCAAERFDSQRLGDQYGTLLAGAWSLMSSDVVTPEQAYEMIDANDWEPYSQSTELPDETRCIRHILQTEVRVEADKPVSRTVGELVEIALFRVNDMTVTASEAIITLGRNGIKAEDGAVIISNTAKAIAEMLNDTPWRTCHSTLLKRLHGATNTNTIYFKGAGTTSRAVRVPIESFDS
jgi:putative DNA primase/helicase